MARRSRRAVTNVKLRPADPFDLIRWLARSQSDPRKAVCELVQNSIDAQARHVALERRRVRGVPLFMIRDDGEGVLPEMEREAALRYIAEHIGHSMKLKLSPSERRERVVAGKYGVGLLGFWAIGHRFEMRSRVRGSAVWALRLVEDSASGEVLELPARTDDPETFTEIVVSDLHDTAMRQLGGARLQTYLGAELRGQLLQSDLDLVVNDRMARGVQQKRFPVRPRRFLGERLQVPSEIAVEGHSPLRVELYLQRGAEEAAVQLACAGTTVADSFAELAAIGLAQSPWLGRSLSGVIDFLDLNVPPGTRRGVVPDEAAEALASAVEALRPGVEAELERLERERRAASGRDVVRDLRHALRGFGQRFPHYELPEVGSGSGTRPRPEATPGEVLEQDTVEHPESPSLPLFPPGPLESVAIHPEEITIAPGTERRIGARAHDHQGAVLRHGVEFAWSIDRADLGIQGDGPRPALYALSDAAPGLSAIIRVEARQGERRATAQADVAVIEAPPSEPPGTQAGVPEPQLVSDPGSDWRSRFDGRIWQVNDAHDDYLALRADPRARLRYLLALFAKEIVQRSWGTAGSGPILERIVEVLAHAERNLKGG